MKQVIKGPQGISITIDTQDEHTPVYVELDTAGGSWEMAFQCGHLIGHEGDRVLSPVQMKWLAKYEEQVYRAYDIADQSCTTVAAVAQVDGEQS